MGRLDDVSGIHWGGQTNVIAVRVDASWGSGHWYEGGGLYRSVHLQRTPPLHFLNNGIFLSPEGDGSSGSVSAEIEYSGSPPSADALVQTVTFTLTDDDQGTKLAECD